MKDFERGDIAKVDWLDRMAFRQIEAVHAVSPLRRDAVLAWMLTASVQAEAAKSDKLFLYVDLPKFNFPVVFSESVSHCNTWIRKLSTR
jgi:phosphatidylinositol 3-kinase